MNVAQVSEKERIQKAYLANSGLCNSLSCHLVAAVLKYQVLNRVASGMSIGKSNDGRFEVDQTCSVLSQHFLNIAKISYVDICS